MPSSRSENRPVTFIDFAKIDAAVRQPGANAIQPGATAIYQPSAGQRIRPGVQGPTLNTLVDEQTSPHQQAAPSAPKARDPSVSRREAAHGSRLGNLSETDEYPPPPNTIAPPLVHLPSPSKSLDWESESPDWESKSPDWESLFDLELGKDRWFLVAQSTAKDSRLLLVQKFTGPEIKNLSFLKSLNHKNIAAETTTVEQIEQGKQIQQREQIKRNLSFLKSLNHKNIAAEITTVKQKNMFLIAWEFMPMCLQQVARGRFLTELKVASILGQVLEGLQYLYSRELEHAGLSCSTVLIDSAGVVKIGGLEHCRHIESAESLDTKPLKRLTMELANGSYIDGSNSSITNPTLQKSGSLLDFLAGLDARCKISDLRKHKLFRQKWTPESLRGLVSYANYFTLWSRNYPAESA